MLSCGESKKDVPVKKIKATTKVDSTGKIIYDTTVSKDPVDQRKAEKINELFTKLAKNKQFNGAILVADEGKIIYADAKGYANFAAKKELSIHSSFHLASVSKQFTAMAIMMLKEKGKLNYDEDVRKYLPNLPYEGITVRHLLNHTSGVPNIMNYIPYFMKFWDSCEVARNCDIPYMFNKNKPRVSFKPGQRFSYNNTGYVLLALIVENVSKVPYNEFVEKNIFEPLDMQDSKVYTIVKEPHIRNRVYGYGQYRSYYNLDEDDVRNGLMGEKGVYSSVIDLYKWDQALYTDVLVKQETLQEAFEYGIINSGKKINYGFGWRKAKNDENIVYHFGHWRGFKTCIIRFLDEKKLIVILNNTGSRRIKSLSQELIKILYSDKKDVPKL
jgi:CubicO group peptidase (beta-lactamase class C family)